ncbi:MULTISPECIES: ABC transporter substrate-binding protein [unclassified Mesorhizobium]|uniref:ABC transporter substrate-binding protein n=1 Tax=unclassified Mesorhizobium TaxID=325217 RepID=UPI000FD8AF31|nr:MULTISPECIES: ABC transporter substrate-binding protein [unclassified Mesorhizobium]TGT71910.1 ABC transporter substrate-binding protein [Mesorhizobium sp. M2E.F.Ca.ET.166.01.1.1]TGV99375.1 ABC transporter substrate-binding protein [Mesorhizobium sp. M2E.F.Ca.ET.154.01.1.1]
MWTELEYLSRSVAAGKLSRRNFLGRALALGATASFASLLLTNAVKAAGPVRGGILKAGLIGKDPSLDPALAQVMTQLAFLKSWGEVIVEYAPDGGIEYRIAEEANASKDAKTWTLKIRDGIEFHNGKTVTAEDVAATLERHMNPNSKSAAFSYLKGVDTVKVDGKEVVIALKEPNADLPYLLADYHLVVQPNGGKDDPNAGIGAGPYKVTVNEPGVRFGGERFANYWQPDKMGFADQIEILAIGDTTPRMAALQSGQVHMVNGIDPKIVDRIKQVPGITVRETAGPTHFVFDMACDKAPYDNVDLRMALKLAIDREAILEKVLLGHGSLGNDFPINASYPLFTEIEQRKYDPDQAKFYYKKSGHEGPLVFRVSDVAFTGAVDAGQLFQYSAAKAGINIEVKREPADSYFAEVVGKQPFFADNWGGRSTQDLMYSVAYASTAAWNFSNFRNEKFDSLLVAARGEFDQAKRKQMYYDMAVILRDEGGIIMPAFMHVLDGTGPNVGGWIDDPHQQLMNGYGLAKCWLTA